MTLLKNSMHSHSQKQAKYTGSNAACGSLTTQECYNPALPLDSEVEFEIMVPVTAKGIVKGLTDKTIRMTYGEDTDQCYEVKSLESTSNQIESSIRSQRALAETPGYLIEITDMKMTKPVYSTVMVNTKDILQVLDTPNTSQGQKYLAELIKQGN